MNIELTIKNLKSNRMVPYFVKTKEEAKELMISLMKEGETVSVGGSMTLAEIGAMEELRSGKYNFLDRAAEGADREKIYRDSFFADTYITSSNAITESGELYNVDGNGNRVSAMIFGPKSVIVIAGKNKIVKNLEEAAKRVKKIAAPKNTSRLSCDTYCSETGVCVAAEAKNMCDGCKSESRICASYVALSYQRIKDRIKVIIVDEELGY